MHKTMMAIMSLVAATSLLFCGCAAAPPEEAELLPCEAELAGIYPLFSGKESVSKTVVLAISNPNEYEVAIDSLGFILVGNGALLGGTQITDDIYIPANTEVRIETTTTVGFSDIIAFFMGKEGLGPPQASAKAVPIWKSLDGQLAIPALQPVWDAAPDTKALYELDKGTLSMRSPSGQRLNNVSLSGTYQAE